MSLHHDLLAQAQQLVTKEPRRPKQASLRRAVSAAYYSLFHLLVADASLTMLGGSRSRRLARSVLGRCFEHTSMVQCCKAFDSGNLPARMSVFSTSLPISLDLRSVARGFVDLQDERHRADYDVAATFYRGNVQRLVTQAMNATEAWARIRKADEVASFLLCLLFWKTLRER